MHRWYIVCRFETDQILSHHGNDPRVPWRSITLDAATQKARESRSNVTCAREEAVVVGVAVSERPAVFPNSWRLSFLLKATPNYSPSASAYDSPGKGLHLPMVAMVGSQTDCTPSHYSKTCRVASHTNALSSAYSEFQRLGITRMNFCTRRPVLW